MNIDDVKKYIDMLASNHISDRCTTLEIPDATRKHEAVLKWLDDVNTSAGRGDETVTVVTQSHLEYIFKAAENIRQSKENYNHDTDTYLRNIVENNRVEAIDIQNLIKHLKGER